MVLVPVTRQRGTIHRGGGVTTTTTTTGPEAPARRATIDDLYKVEGKAELVNGRLQIMEASGHIPGQGTGALFANLFAHVRRTRSGFACGDNVGFRVYLPHRESFSPDAAYYTSGASGMKFVEGAPLFAAEVRSEGDYGPAAEAEMAAKRADYFAAGTLVVWDVDLLSRDVVRVYRATDPHQPTICRRGEVAEAEPAVPGWRLPVDELSDTWS
jgi:Uma2 family endonuclease